MLLLVGDDSGLFEGKTHSALIFIQVMTLHLELVVWCR